ncbi:arylsulfatase B [Ixodes scapularis]
MEKDLECCEIRRARPDELDRVAALRALYGQQLGVGAMDTLWNLDPEGIFVAVTDDALVTNFRQESQHLTKGTAVGYVEEIQDSAAIAVISEDASPTQHKTITPQSSTSTHPSQPHNDDNFVTFSPSSLCDNVGGSVPDLGDIDGVDMWDSLLKDSASPRLEVLHNIDPIWNMSALRYGDFKYVQGSYDDGRFDNWYKPAGLTHPSNGGSSVRYRDNVVDKSGIFGTECAASETILALGRSLPVRRDEEVQVSCGKTNGTVCKPLLEPCLFRINSDPCEIDNVANKYPEIMKLMTQRIEMHAKTMVPPINKPPTRKADPRNFNFTWAPYERDENYEYIIANHRDNT